MNDTEIEREIQAKGKTAARVTPQRIEDVILQEVYFTALDGANGSGVPPFMEDKEPLSLLTFCVLVLRNGFTVTGESACASPENFDAEIGRKVARANAVQKVWPLEGYLLKQRLFEDAGRAALTDADVLADLNGAPRPDNPTTRGAEVYSRPECRFNYCSSPGTCKSAGRCVNAA